MACEYDDKSTLNTALIIHVVHIITSIDINKRYNIIVQLAS